MTKQHSPDKKYGLAVNMWHWLVYYNKTPFRLAVHTGLSFQTVLSHLNLTSYPSDQSLKKYCMAFDTSLSILTGPPTEQGYKLYHAEKIRADSAGVMFGEIEAMPSLDTAPAPEPETKSAPEPETISAPEPEPKTYIEPRLLECEIGYSTTPTDMVSIRIQAVMPRKSAHLIAVFVHEQFANDA